MLVVLFINRINVIIPSISLLYQCEHSLLSFKGHPSPPLPASSPFLYMYMLVSDESCSFIVKSIYTLLIFFNYVAVEKIDNNARYLGAVILNPRAIPSSKRWREDGLPCGYPGFGSLSYIGCTGISNLIGQRATLWKCWCVFGIFI